MEEKWIFHDSHDIQFREPFGAVRTGSRVSLSLDISTKEMVECVLLKVDFKGGSRVVQMSPEKDWDHSIRYSVTIDAPDDIGLMWYYFLVIKDSRVFYYGDNERRQGGEGKVYLSWPLPYQITVYSRDFKTPGWFHDSVMYQIFVDRFYKSKNYDFCKSPEERNKWNISRRVWDDVPRYVRKPSSMDVIGYDFFGGNLEGIIEKLDYLERLGVSVIYLNPIFESVSNHKYDTGDYKKVDPYFGTEEDFERMCNEASKRGIRIILDGVFSHTGSDSVYFNKLLRYDSVGAYNSMESPYYSWYRFTEYPEKYDCWWGFDTLPNVNELDPSFVDFIVESDDSVIKRWIGKGASGWRLDVADELPDEFIMKIRNGMKKKYPDSVLIGEVWEDASNKVSYGIPREYILGSGLDSVMNYPFRNLCVDFLLYRKNALEVTAALKCQLSNYPKEVVYSLMNHVGTHDTERILTVLGEAPISGDLALDEKEMFRLSAGKLRLGKERLKLISLIQMTYPGVPSLYYGDEAGIQGFKDPLNRSTYPWGREDMDLVAWYRRIISLRNDNPILRRGEIMLFDTNEDIISFVRRCRDGEDVFGDPMEKGVFCVLINRSEVNDYNVSVDMKAWYDTDFLMNALDEREIYSSHDGKFDILLKPLSAKVLMSLKA